MMNVVIYYVHSPEISACTKPVLLKNKERAVELAQGRSSQCLTCTFSHGTIHGRVHLLDRTRATLAGKHWYLLWGTVRTFIAPSEERIYNGSVTSVRARSPRSLVCW